MKPNNLWNDNPCFGIWKRKDDGEYWWSAPDGYDPNLDVVTLRSYRKMGEITAMRPTHVHERFDFMGFGRT